MEGPIADHRAQTVIHIEYGSEAEIDTAGTHLLADHETNTLRQPRRLMGMGVVQAAEGTHRRDRREAVAEALHASSFVVDRNQERRAAQAVHFFGQRRHLLR